MATTGRADRTNCGVVVIGRNEGERLRRCLASCPPDSTLVYVDSASTDASVDVARESGADVVALDLANGFTAALARNEGFKRLMSLEPGTEFVMFVDGDCELCPGWMESALAFLRDRPDVVAVCGRRRERYPQASIFNQLCDIEWNTPPGEAKAFGGDVVLRADALRTVGGYRDSLIAGEEPELCVRLRGAGGRIWRLDRDMTWHDAAITALSQWWRRNKRSGHAFAEGAFLHGRSSERHFVLETRRALVWGVALPLAILLLAAMSSPWVLVAFVVYLLQWLRIGARFARAGTPIPWTHAAFILLGRLPEAQGVLKFWLGRLRGQRSAIIEYK
jgi:glycosyltransferase involved in cell wall biosynthesis